MSDKAKHAAEPEEAPVVEEQVEAAEKPKTVDSHEQSIGWTVQSDHSHQDEPKADGQSFEDHEFPTVAGLVETGVKDVEAFFANLRKK